MSRPSKELQWGHDDGVVEWHQEREAVSCPDRDGFNGATTMVSWNG